MLEMLASQLLLPCSATKGKESQTLGGGGDPPQGAFDGIEYKIEKIEFCTRFRSVEFH